MGAAEPASRRPALVFRNPDKLKQLAERMRAYWEHHMRRIADRNLSHGIGGDGRIAGRPATSPQLELPLHLTESRTVGLIYNDVEGLNFYADVALVAEAFANPQIVNRQPYLKDGSISPLPFRRLAEQDTAKASRLFQLLLKRPAFSWEADGEALLRRRKRAFFDKPALPSVTPLGGMALEQYRSAAPGQGEQRLAGVLQIEAG